MEGGSLPQTASLDPRSPSQLEVELSCPSWVEILKSRGTCLKAARCVDHEHHGWSPCGVIEPRQCLHRMGEKIYSWDLLQSILWGGEVGGGTDELDWSELLTMQTEHGGSKYHSLCFCVCSRCSVIKRSPKCQGRSIQRPAHTPHALD